MFTSRGLTLHGRATLGLPDANRPSLRLGLLAIATALAASATGPAWSQASSSSSTSSPPTAYAISLTTIMDEIASLSNQISATLAAQRAALIDATALQVNATLQQANKEMQAGSAAIAGALTSLVVSMGAAALSVGASGSSAEMTHAMSCPVFVGDGTLLGEDGCLWAKATGQRTSQFGVSSDSAGFHVGGQREIAEGWFLGGSLGAGSSWMQAGGAASLGQSFSGSVALKRVQGPWLLAGAVAAGTTATHITRPAGGGTMQGDSNVFQGGVRLRGAYDLAFAGWYARPRLDLDAYTTTMGSFQEYGPSSVALAVSGAAKTGVAIAPALELGGRVAAGALLGGETILRPYVIGGVMILPDNNFSIYTGFAGPLAPFGGFRTVFIGPPVVGTLEAGLQLYAAKGLELKAEYRLAAGESFVSQGVGLRGAWHF